VDVYYRIEPWEDRLPKKAQDHIRYLRASIRTLQSALEQDVSDSDTFLQVSHSVEPEALGKGPMILFRIDVDNLRGREFRVSIKGEVLQVYADTGLIYKPTSTNIVELRMDR
jgi:hypothetical protein